jgi:hypothetical protein
VNQPQQPTVGDDFHKGVNFACALASAHAHCLYPFLRFGYGMQVPGVQGVFAVLVMVLAFLIAKDIAILKFLGAWVLATLVQRSVSFHRHLRGYREHSRYEGYPWLGSLLALGRDGTVARVYEPFLAVMFGCVLSNWSEPLAIFVASGFFSLLFVLIVSETAKSRRVTAIVDMEIEQRALAERVRRYRDGS